MVTGSRLYGRRFTKDGERVVAERVPLTEIIAFLDLYDIRGVNSRAKVVRIVQRMDTAYCERVNS